jgi:F-type H+-transporting ATPase subunit epsilon
MAPEALLLELVTPDREVVHASVAEIQIPAKSGYLGVLPGHTPLLAELGIGALSYKKGSETQYVAVLGGFVEVLPDRVTVLADAAERADEIDAGAARAAVAAAQDSMAKAMANPATDWDQVLQSIAVANTRLEVAGHGAKGSGSVSTTH